MSEIQHEEKTRDKNESRLGLTCIVCLRNLDDAMGGRFDDSLKQPHGGTTFTTRGHYGSTSFDPMIGDESLAITVCDTCLVDRLDNKVIAHLKGEEVTPWELSEDSRQWIQKQAKS